MLIVGGFLLQINDQRPNKNPQVPKKKNKNRMSGMTHEHIFNSDGGQECDFSTVTHHFRQLGSGPPHFGFSCN